MDYTNPEATSLSYMRALFYSFYHEYFKLKSKFLTQEIPPTMEIEVKRKLIVLEDIVKLSKRPRKLVEICLDYIKLDLSTMIKDKLKEDFPYAKDEFLYKCMRDTEEFLIFKIKKQSE